MKYEKVYNNWKKDPETFWLRAAEAIDWQKPPTFALDSKDPPFYEWFPDSLVNTCFNAIDRHILNGRKEQNAIIYDSPMTGKIEHITYGKLKERTALLSGALLSKGIKKGDRVIIYMPMIPEALIGMLACARIGAIHSVVFGGFAASELAIRIDDATPKAILAASCGLEPGKIIPYKPLIDSAIDQAKHKPDTIFMFQRPEAPAELVTGRDHDWCEVQKDVKPSDCVPVEGNHPAYILYTSGTTGAPKGVVRPTAGHLVSLHWSMKNIYNVNPGEVFWAASDVGWVVGHSYICYAPLIHGNTTILFEGKPVGTPDASTFWRIISQHNVSCFFTAPTAFRAIKRDDPKGKLRENYDLSCLRTLFLAGERADPDTIYWAQNLLGVPVIDHWWQTETGWTIAGNPMGIEQLPIKIGSSSVAMPGYEIKILDDEGETLRPNKLGAIAIKLPLPPGALPTLWGAKARYKSSYLDTFKGYYETGDAGMIDEDGYIFVMARTDDVINVAGHRLSTGSMEEVLAEHPDVAECAVIGVADKLKGQVPIGLLCLSRGVTRNHEEIVSECVQMVREKIGPVAAFKNALVIDRLPKTRSGKILRGTITKIADKQKFKMPATIDDPIILEEIKVGLNSLGLA